MRRKMTFKDYLFILISVDVSIVASGGRVPHRTLAFIDTAFRANHFETTSSDCRRDRMGVLSQHRSAGSG